jgi:hypothetical protein
MSGSTLTTDEQIDEILDWSSHALVEALVEQVNYGTKVEISQELLDKYKAEAHRRLQVLMDGARLRGYNSGWVKANRLTAKPEAVEYFASQLEQAAKILREASLSPTPSVSGREEEKI